MNIAQNFCPPKNRTKNNHEQTKTTQQKQKGADIISKHNTPQKYIYKLHSSTLAKYNWDYILPLHEAIYHKKDAVPLASSQILRFIERLNNTYTDSLAKTVKNEIKNLKRQTETPELKEQIKEKYNQLYHIQFQPDYLCVIMDSKSHYDRANKGFTVNNISYHHLLGTNGGIKNSTIVYVSDNLYPKLKEIINAGRNESVPLIPQKFEAYEALVCSASTPLSMPNGIIVVPDCETIFKDNVIYIDDSLTDEPTVTYKQDVEFNLTESDGYGLMLPTAAERWYKELNHTEGCLSGMNVRGLPWTKGMLYPFDFIDFAEKKNNGNYIVKDVWGNERDVREAEVILTASMLKLWNCYSSWEDYWFNVVKYGYQFAVAKTAPDELENERATNYQFLQSYRLDDAAIEELISPTLDKINDVLGEDYMKSLLFFCGENLNEQNVFKNRDWFIQALMIEPKLINDPYVRNKLYRMIKKKINDAKIGVIDIHANYAIIGGDPYSLCQSMFGQTVTGLLKKGECYHKYWSDRNVPEVVCFRAPMTSMNNIRKLRPVATQEMQYWYKHINTCLLLNSWDSTCEALNGADKDK